MISRTAANALHAFLLLGLGGCFPASAAPKSLPNATTPGTTLPSETWARIYEDSVPGVVYILSEGLCSGALIEDDLVLTAWHCVEGNRTLRVGYDKETRRKGAYDFEGGVVVAAADRKNDLAVLRLPSKATGNAKILRLAKESTEYRPGEEVATIGHPVGLSPLSPTGLQEAQLHVLTKGPIAKSNADLIVADMLVLPGNSGGPVFNQQGDIVGVVSARHREGDLGYFVPAARIHAVVTQAKAHGPKGPPVNRRPVLGSQALRVHAAFEADRYAAHLFGGSQNISTVSPSLTVLGTLQATWTTRIGPQTVRKRQWDVALLRRTEVSRLLDVELGVGGGQVVYSHEHTGESRQSALVKAFVGAGGAQLSFHFPSKDFGRPSVAFGLNLLNLF